MSTFLANLFKQMPVSCSKACWRALVAGSKKCLRAFAADQRGAFLIFFTITLPLLLGFVVLSVEGSRYVYDKARMSDALEQAAQALTVAAHMPPGDGANIKLVKAYIRANAPDQGNSTDASAYITDVVPTREGKPAVWRVSGKIQRESWFPFQGLTASFLPLVSVGNHGAAQNLSPSPRRAPMPEDIAFVLDLSGSMGEFMPQTAVTYTTKKAYEALCPEDNKYSDNVTEASNPGSDLMCERKISVLKRVMLKLTDTIHRANSNTKMALDPFQNLVGSVIGGQSYCAIPWYSDPHIGSIQTNQPATQTAIDYAVDIEKTLHTLLAPVNRWQTVLVPAPSSLTQQQQDMRQYLCDRPPTSSVALTSDIKKIKTALDAMEAGDSTFLTAGILDGAKMLGQGRASKKRLIMISDGNDNQYYRASEQLFGGFVAKKNAENNKFVDKHGKNLPDERDIEGVNGDGTPKWSSYDTANDLVLEKKVQGGGLCTQLKSKGIALTFIGVGYTPDIASGLKNRLEECVGRDNFYLAYDVKQLEKDLAEAAGMGGPNNDREVGRNIDKYQ